jgi:hypothetical protein
MDCKAIKYYKDTCNERLGRITYLKEQLVTYKELNTLLQNKVNELQNKEIKVLNDYCKNSSVNDKYIYHLELVNDKMKQELKHLQDSNTAYEKLLVVKNDIINIYYQKFNPENRTNCAVCFNRPKDILFYPCKHLSVCSECSDIIRETNNKCVICREVIDHSEKIYI